MSQQANTHIRVRPDTRDQLFELKDGPTDTYDDVLRRELGLEE
jgi:hypothetical protein